MSVTQTGCETGSASGHKIGRGTPLVFFGMAALLFAAATVATILSCAAMETMGAVPMAGGWLLSGIWLPLCGQSWLETAGCFLGMWFAMMVAMMLPSLTLVLWRYQEAAFKAGASRPGGFAALAGAGYFAVWTGLGLPVFLVGAALAQIALQFPALSRLGPAASASVVLMAGLSQFSRRKARKLAGCSASRQQSQTPPNTLAALRAGAALGLRCCLSCIGPMAILIVGGLMDLPLMLCVTLAITAERLLPPEMRIGQATGAGMSVAGLLLFLRSLG